ncbi:DinB family protein [Algoriphagus halophytocola]|uniref:DinB family protein n=1 Tax=Algoriphagus halophytocola TaxID=2991499 RepID=A0ABY6MI34_9BACT|nr:MULTISPECIES: DinB family protein [unclassified Algoriphagus]UZD23430.1 DinB family protein [Algoriphagus sp. TR-M5]WBL44725.1 DinB family protein [Algoriphagus sp. TR-M9]
MNPQPEVWLRGPLPDYPSALQPIAHAILQAQEEIHRLMEDFPSELLWEKPAGLASPAFHLQHIAGVLNRMATYARAEPLTAVQFAYLKSEGVKNQEFTTAVLIQNLDLYISQFLEVLKQTNPDTLNEFRGVGRAKLPSTVGGLLFHAAEHMQRHFGQLLVTVKVILSEQNKSKPISN